MSPATFFMGNECFPPVSWKLLSFITCQLKRLCSCRTSAGMTRKSNLVSATSTRPTGQIGQGLNENTHSVSELPLCPCSKHNSKTELWLNWGISSSDCVHGKKKVCMLSKKTFPWQITIKESTAHLTAVHQYVPAVYFTCCSQSVQSISDFAVGKNDSLQELAWVPQYIFQTHVCNFVHSQGSNVIMDKLLHHIGLSIYGCLIAVNAVQL